MSTLGRPTKYTEALAEEICEAVASSSDGLNVLCEEHSHWPSRSNIFIWMRKYADFRDKYTQAKKEQCEVFIDYIQELMSESHMYLDERGNDRVDVSMLRLKVDTIKWQASKLLPKLWGDKYYQDASNPQETLQKIQSLVADLNKTNQSDI